MTTIFEVFGSAKEVLWTDIAIATADNYRQREGRTLKAVTTTAFTNVALEIHYLKRNALEKWNVYLSYTRERIAAQLVLQGLAGQFLAAELQEDNSIEAAEKGRKALADIKAAVSAIGVYRVALYVLWEELRVCTSPYPSDYNSPILVITMPVEVDYRQVIAESKEVKAFFENVIAAEKAVKEAQELELKQQEEMEEIDRQEVMRNTIGATLVAFESGRIKMRRTDGSMFYIDAGLEEYNQCCLKVDGVKL